MQLPSSALTEVQEQKKSAESPSLMEPRICGATGCLCRASVLAHAAHLCDSLRSHDTSLASYPIWAQKAVSERGASTNLEHSQAQALACPGTPGQAWPGPVGTRPLLPGRAPSPALGMALAPTNPPPCVAAPGSAAPRLLPSTSTRP